MPIPFHDAEDIEELGAAAFLHIESPAAGSAERRGALLFINARGEPLEFVYNRIELLSSVLWRPADRELAAVRRLSLTLFHAATLTPALLLGRANTLAPNLLGPEGQIVLHVPIGRVAIGEEAVGSAADRNPDAREPSELEASRTGEESEPSQIFWTPAAPTGMAAALFARLAERGLLLEPFERAAKGLQAVYGEDPHR